MFRANRLHLERETEWSLEAVYSAFTSKVWDEHFASDDEAFAEFERTVAEERMRTFLDKENAIPSVADCACQKAESDGAFVIVCTIRGLQGLQGRDLRDLPVSLRERRRQVWTGRPPSNVARSGRGPP